MKTFVVPDIHGRHEALCKLLRAADIIDNQNEKTELGKAIQLVSIGDLLNAVHSDIGGDEETFRMVDLFDVLILGNHEAPYLGFGSFGGYFAHPPLRAGYNGLYRQGAISPCLRIGNTLLTHAGVHKHFAFKTAATAEIGIMDVWTNWADYKDDYDKKFTFSNVEIPKALLLEGVSGKRGGSAPFGGILWSDWDEPKNQNFSQVVGHTPIKEGPTINAWDASEVVHVNIDCAAKRGETPVGVWLDESGNIEEFVRADNAPSLLTAWNANA